MGYDPEKHHRHSTRLRGYDYRLPGAYFVTICSWQRQTLFDGTELRRILLETWQKLPGRYSNLSLDTLVVMPDHIHGILHLNAPAKHMPGPTLSDIMRVYKSITSVSWIRYNKSGNMACGKHLWQERFYDHVIRNEKHLPLIRDYILHNPLQPEILQGKDLDEDLWDEVMKRFVLGDVDGL
jgi:putative transposase